MKDQRLESSPEPGALLEGWLTRAQVAAQIGVSSDTLARWQTRRIGPPCVRIGRKVFYRAERVRDWLTSREHGGRLPLADGADDSAARYRSRA
jgi:hypothetical protein